MFGIRNTRSVLAAAVASVAALSTLTSGVADAATRTATFDVTLKIIADCTISASALDFGQNQGILNAAVSINTTLAVTCTNTTPYNLGLSAGTGTGSTVAARVMSGTTGGNTSTVAFNLYQAAGTTNWGNTPGTDTKSATGSGVTQSHTVYGVVPAQSTPQPDTYKSTITATVYF